MVVLNLVIALVLEQFRLKDDAKLAIQRKELLKAVRTSQVILPCCYRRTNNRPATGMSATFLE